MSDCCIDGIQKIGLPIHDIDEQRCEVLWYSALKIDTLCTRQCLAHIIQCQL